MSDNPTVEPADKFYETAEAEPLTPTEEAVTEQEQEPEQEVEILETPEKSEESEESEVQYLDLDDTEVSLEDVRKWRDGHLMQSDYTKKTTALSEERKSFDEERATERENLSKEKESISEMRDTLAVLVAEDDSINWIELKEDDPERYIELKELADKRKDALAKIKADRETPADDPAFLQAEQGKLIAANPEWFDKDGKTTEVHAADTKLANEYVNKAGGASEFEKTSQAQFLMAIIKAAKYDELQGKSREITEKRVKVPVVTKPKANETAGTVKSRHEKFYGS